MLSSLKRRVKRSLMSPTARAVQDERLTMCGATKLLRLERTAKAALRRGIAGEVAEFGMALGGSGIILARIARAGGREFHGFDVFGMIPPPTSDKDDEKSKARYEEIAAGRSAGIGGDTYYGYVEDLRSKVAAAFARHGLPVGEGVQLHEGLFEHTVPRDLPPRLCLAHIDCDWYDPTRHCLAALADRLSPGSAIVMDDYHNYGGSRTATDEFLAVRRDFSMEDGENVVLRKA